VPSQSCAEIRSSTAVVFCHNIEDILYAEHHCIISKSNTAFPTFSPEFQPQTKPTTHNEGVLRGVPHQRILRSEGSGNATLFSRVSLLGIHTTRNMIGHPISVRENHVALPRFCKYIHWWIFLLFSYLALRSQMNYHASLQAFLTLIAF
jgi:hypothetical protein